MFFLNKFEYLSKNIINIFFEIMLAYVLFPSCARRVSFMSAKPFGNFGSSTFVRQTPSSQTSQLTSSTLQSTPAQVFTKRAWFCVPPFRASW